MTLRIQSKEIYVNDFPEYVSTIAKNVQMGKMYYIKSRKKVLCTCR